MVYLSTLLFAVQTKRYGTEPLPVTTMAQEQRYRTTFVKVFVQHIGILELQTTAHLFLADGKQLYGFGHYIAEMAAEFLFDVLNLAQLFLGY